LTNPGAEHEAILLAEAQARLHPLGVPLIASIFAGTVAEFAEVARIVAAAGPDLIEVNISCPNVGDEFGTPFAGSPETAAAVAGAVRQAVILPISVKLAPNVPDIARVAAAVVEAGADAITAINTVPGMVVDAVSGQPVLSNRVGGISGPALKPVALRCVYEIAQAVDVPIIGTGGVISGRDAAEMMAAGATLVGVGSAVWYRGVDAFREINLELAEIVAGRREGIHRGGTEDAEDSEKKLPPAKWPYATAGREQAAGLPQAMRVAGIRDENAATKTLVLDGALDAQPGQFVMAWLPDVGERPFSLADVDPVSLTVAAVGPFTQALHRLALGDRLWVRGPLGRGYRLPEAGTPARHYLLVGGGYGVAPLHLLARRLLALGHQVSTVIGARRAQDLLLVRAFRDLGVALWLATEDGSQGLRGLATDAMLPALDGAPMETAAVYACGPTGMLRAVAATCRARGLPVQVSWEAPMRCGIGLCGSCEVGAGWLACLDGPVFDFDPCDHAPDHSR
jgi:dihydroorotate dehydrogenase (NAD+) catalytic subunit